MWDFQYSKHDSWIRMNLRDAWIWALIFQRKNDIDSNAWGDEEWYQWPPARTQIAENGSIKPFSVFGNIFDMYTFQWQHTPIYTEHERVNERWASRILRSTHTWVVFVCVGVYSIITGVPAWFTPGSFILWPCLDGFMVNQFSVQPSIYQSTKLWPFRFWARSYVCAYARFGWAIKFHFPP